MRPTRGSFSDRLQKFSHIASFGIIPSSRPVILTMPGSASSSDARRKTNLSASSVSIPSSTSAYHTTISPQCSVSRHADSNTWRRERRHADSNTWRRESRKQLVANLARPQGPRPMEQIFRTERKWSKDNAETIIYISTITMANNNSRFGGRTGTNQLDRFRPAA